MHPPQTVPFRKIIKRLTGVYAILNIVPNDSIGGVIKSIDKTGIVTFGMNQDMTTNVRFIRSVTIPNEDEDRAIESPLFASLNQNQAE